CLDVVGTARRWTAVTGREREPLGSLPRRDMPSAAVFSPDGKTLALPGADKSVELWDPARGQKRHTLKGHPGGILQLTFSADGRLLASADGAGTIRLWEVAGGTALRHFRAAGRVTTALALSPDGKYLAAGGWVHGPGARWVRLYDSSSDRELGGPE